jgi:Asp-tRNA(Asn)/Glu-tRNA(Gln) amidotransferase A subunit family amidase
MSCEEPSMSRLSIPPSDQRPVDRDATHRTSAEVMAPNDTVGAFVGAPTVLARGQAGGPLDGERLAVKDLFDIAGTVTGAGSPAFAAAGAAAATSASAVERLVAAGATVVGRTVTDELAYSLTGTNVHFGTPHNVRAPNRVPGGSSAGSAAAVAAGIAELGLGTDTGGSIRVPASYCGLLGWRSTHGSVPMDGIVPLAPSFDTVGLLADDAGTLLAGAGALLDDSTGDDAPLRCASHCSTRHSSTSSRESQQHALLSSRTTRQRSSSVSTWGLRCAPSEIVRAGRPGEPTASGSGRCARPWGLTSPPGSPPRPRSPSRMSRAPTTSARPCELP